MSKSDIRFSSLLHLVLVLLLLILLAACSSSSQSEHTPSRDEFIDVEVEPRPLTSIGDRVAYPAKALREGLEGDVIIAALIGKDGVVEKTEVLESNFKIFEETAIDAIQNTRFSPALAGGKPVQIWFTIPIRFKMPANSIPK